MIAEMSANKHVADFGADDEFDHVHKKDAARELK